MTEKLYGTVLIKASQILDVLSDGKSKSVHDIVLATDIAAPTVSKILTTLLAIRYVAKNQQTHEYRMGTKLIQFGQIRTNVTELIEITRPYLDALQSRVDETIHLSVLENDQVTYVRKLEPKHQNIFMTSKVGLTRELYSAGMGKAVLSSFSDQQINSYIDNHELKPFTDHTITTATDLWQDIRKTRERGYAVDDEEQEKDCYCIASTLFQGTQLVGAMSISVPKFRITDDYKQLITSELLRTKKQIQSVLNAQ